MQTDREFKSMSKTTMCGRYDQWDQFTWGAWDFVMKKPKYYCHDCYNAWLSEAESDKEELRAKNAVRIAITSAMTLGTSNPNRHQRRSMSKILHIP
jgi:hypothetical protein